MNQLLFERATGGLGANTFAKLETTRLLRSFRPAPQFRFDGGEKGAAVDNGEGSSSSANPSNDHKSNIWAHQAGVNALALERFDGRILLSGGSDATIKLWDIEQCGNPNNSHVYKPVAQIARSDDKTKSHRFGITHLSFYPFDPAAFLSSSYDQTLKLWATDSVQLSGANTLASFGPSIKNGQLANTPMFTTPVGLTPRRKELLFWPNDTEILVMDLHEGTTVSRLRGVGANISGVRAQRGGERTVKNRVTSVVWRGAGGAGGSSGIVPGASNVSGGVYSGHTDGQIRAWVPQVRGLDEEDEDDTSEVAQQERVQKRKALDDAFKSLMGQKITFN
ncbi:hypothetical protein INS49_012764 [Diaporthe citri]|uniref:uncharacterized protein n=1 Tax=Diaporthe citri TaxID=83186 RepID=UPI001C81DDF5|nr:uncharacterized protein INS49_012764 [Diaporthe citri]KAG6359243.1 hypothetical protein INS49_012764 [Diaporthe citri]